MQLLNQKHLLLLINYRYLFILLQFLAVLVCQQVLNYHYDYLAIYSIVCLELVINLGLHFYYKSSRNVRPTEYLFQILLDTGFLAGLLYFTGGATNPFVSLLILPVAIAAVTLSKLQLIIVALLSLSTYSALLFSLDPHHMHHMDMQQHFIGMWFNFILSALVVVAMVAVLARAMNKQERLVSKLREEQLRQEKVVALGTAAAQFAHQLATPLATAKLQAEELQEQLPHADKENQELLSELQLQLGLCGRKLQDFRSQAELVKLDKRYSVSCEELLEQFSDELQLNFPSAMIEKHLSPNHSGSISTDSSLLPALLNLVQNAIQSSFNQIQQYKVCIESHFSDNQLTLRIRDFGKGFSEQHLLSLGTTMVDSHKGLGMGVLLSHATLERLGAQLSLYNHVEGGAVAEVALQLESL